MLWSSWLEFVAFEGPVSRIRRHGWERSFAFPLPLPLLRPERAEEAELAGEGSLFVSSGVVVAGCDEPSVVGGAIATAAFFGAMIVVEFGWM